MHFALLLGFGATAVNPYLALATVTSLAAPQDCPLDVVKASGNYIRAIDKGLLKIMSKMGLPPCAATVPPSCSRPWG